MTTAQPTTTTRGAADALGISERHVRRLLRDKRLVAVGEGQKRRITAISVEAFRDQKRKTDISQGMSLQCPPEAGYQESMRCVMRSLPALSDPMSAARRLGIPAGQFERLMASGDVPSIGIGGARFVPRHWMAAILMRANQPEFERKGEK